MMMDCVPSSCYDGVLYRINPSGTTYGYSPILSSGTICPSGLGCFDSTIGGTTWNGPLCSGCNCPSGNIYPCWYRNILSGNPQLIAPFFRNFSAGTYPLSIMSSGDTFLVLKTATQSVNSAGFSHVNSDGSNCGWTGFDFGVDSGFPIIFQNYYRIILTEASYFDTNLIAVNARLDLIFENMTWLDRNNLRYTHPMATTQIFTTACSGTFGFNFSPPYQNFGGSPIQGTATYFFRI